MSKNSTGKIQENPWIKILLQKLRYKLKRKTKRGFNPHFKFTRTSSRFRAEPTTGLRSSRGKLEATVLHFRFPKSTGLSETPENRGGIASIHESYKFTDRKVDGNKTPALMKMKWQIYLCVNLFLRFRRRSGLWGSTDGLNINEKVNTGETTGAASSRLSSSILLGPWGHVRRNVDKCSALGLKQVHVYKTLAPPTDSN